jgi:tripartite-type tricarboxylate transporter receptor subunit TctC
MKHISLLVAATLCAGVAHAQSYPNKPIRMVVPWPPGQATDLAGRVMAMKMSELLGQPIVVDNKPGAGGTIGTDNAAKSPPDGYTILAASSGPATVSPLLQKLPYDTEKHLTPVHLIGISPYLLVTYPSFPANTAKELVDLIRANPGKYTFASSGTGATAHLITESFNSQAKLNAVHVPYKGSAQSLTDVMTGQIAYSTETLAATGPHVRAGKLKALGISFEKGSTLAPGIPPIAQAASMPGFDVGAWLGIMVPAGTPKEIVARLATEAGKALQTQEVRDRLAGIGIEMIAKGPDEFAAYLKGESARFAAIIKNGNIKLDP